MYHLAIQVVNYGWLNMELFLKVPIFVSDYKKLTCKTMSIMDLDKINFDLIVELLEWIVDGEHQVGTE